MRVHEGHLPGKPRGDGEREGGARNEGIVLFTTWKQEAARAGECQVSLSPHGPRSVQSLSHVQLFASPRTTACQASLSITNSQSLPKLMSIESVMPSNHLILCCPLLPPSTFPSIRVFSNESALCIGGQSIGVTASASVLPMNKAQLIPSSLGNQVNNHICLVGTKGEVSRSRPDEGKRPEPSQTCTLTLESRAAGRLSTNEGLSQADHAQGGAWLPYSTQGGIHNPSRAD